MKSSGLGEWTPKSFKRIALVLKKKIKKIALVKQGFLCEGYNHLLQLAKDW